MHLPSADEIANLFDGAEQIYVGVRARRGPHVTPELFAVSAGQLWCMTAASTIKTKVLSRDPRIAFMATHERGHVLGIGGATVLDPMRPSSMATAATMTEAPGGAAQFVLRNAEELVGAARDALLGRLGNPLPPHRVLIRITPTALATIADGALTGWGWPGPGEVRESPDDAGQDDLEIDLSDVPGALANLADEPGAALGWLSSAGHPLVVPAQWDREKSTALVSSPLFALCEAAGASAAAVTLDRWTGFGPSGKQGLLLRGSGTTQPADVHTLVKLALDRATYWDGVDTSTSHTLDQ